MSFLSRHPQISGHQVLFNDRVFRFASPDEAQQMAQELAACNERGSFWELVDLTARLEAHNRNNRSRTWPWDTLVY